MPDTVLNYLQALPHEILELMLHGNSKSDFPRNWQEGAKGLVQDTEASPSFFPSEDGAWDGLQEAEEPGVCEP